MYDAPGLCGSILASCDSGIRAPGLPSGPGTSTGRRAMSPGSSRRSMRQPQDDVVELLSLDHLRERLAADRHLDVGLDVGHVDPVAGAGLAIDLDLEVGLADDVEHADVLDPRYRPQDVGDPLAVLLPGRPGRCRRA